MLLTKKDSCVLMIDVQEKLLPKIHHHKELLENCKWLLQIAKKLAIPILASEQYPKGLGHTVDELRSLIPQDAWLQKLHFSCASDPDCLKRIEQVNRQQVVIIGIEAHVCVMQTAIELKNKGKQVYVVADAVSSRKELDKELALQRMHDAGIQIISKEMPVFEWLHQSGTPEFKQISQEFLR